MSFRIVTDAQQPRGLTCLELHHHAGRLTGEPFTGGLEHRLFGRPALEERLMGVGCRLEGRPLLWRQNVTRDPGHVPQHPHPLDVHTDLQVAAECDRQKVVRVRHVELDGGRITRAREHRFPVGRPEDTYGRRRACQDARQQLPEDSPARDESPLLNLGSDRRRSGPLSVVQVGHQGGEAGVVRIQTRQPDVNDGPPRCEATVRHASVLRVGAGRSATLAQLAAMPAAVCRLRANPSVSGDTAVVFRHHSGLANQVAVLEGVAMVNDGGSAEQLHELREEVRTCQRLLDLATSLNSTPSLEDLLPAIMQAGRELLHAEASSLLLLDEESGDLVFHVATGEAAPQLAQQRMPATDGIAGWTLQNRAPVVIADAATDERFYRDMDRAVEFETRSMLAVPIEVKGDCIGVMEVVNATQPEGFTEGNVRVATTLAALAGVALDNASMYAKLSKAVLEARVPAPPQLPQYQT